MKLQHLTFIVLWTIVALGLSSCGGGGGIPYPGDDPVEPIYMNYDHLYDIRNLEEQPVEQTKTIVLQHHDFFMMEDGQGIHVYDVEDSTNIKYITFIQIPAISSFTINGNRLYADSWTDLVIIDITDVKNIQVIDRQEDVFILEMIPRNHNGYFVCPDLEKGAILGWRHSYQTEFNCRTL